MGLIRPGVPKTYVVALKKRLGIGSFVETGTFSDRTAPWAAKHLAQVVTIELSEPWMAQEICNSSQAQCSGGLVQSSAPLASSSG